MGATRHQSQNLHPSLTEDQNTTVILTSVASVQAGRSPVLPPADTSGSPSRAEHDTLEDMRADIHEILITREQIAERVQQLGQEIQADLDGLDDDAEILLVPILTGGIIFVADLMRELSAKIRIDVVTVSSYPGTSTSSKGAMLASALPSDLEGKHVLIVDDILDSGGTIRLIREEMATRNPASLKACVLLRKTIESAMNTQCEYVGFDIEDKFVVGCGLDYDHYYRNLPEIGVLKKEAM